MNKDDCAVARQHDVGLAGKVPPVKAKTKALAKKHRSNELFRVCVAAFDRGHHPRALLFRDSISHAWRLEEAEVSDKLGLQGLFEIIDRHCHVNMTSTQKVGYVATLRLRNVRSQSLSAIKFLFKDPKLERRINGIFQILTQLGTEITKSQGPENIGPENAVSSS